MLSELMIARTAMAPREPDYRRIGAVYRLISRLRNRGLGRLLKDAIGMPPANGRKVPSRIKDANGTHWVH